ncbi:MAG: malectin domain-containing carbohydrate-binding protein [Bacteroidia bacterium]
MKISPYLFQGGLALREKQKLIQPFLSILCLFFFMAFGLTSALAQVSITGTPSADPVNIGDNITLDIEVDAGVIDLNTVAINLNFDPAVFQITGNTPGTTLPTSLGLIIDNTNGNFTFSAGILSQGASVNGNFNLISLDLNVVGGSGVSSLAFVTGAGNTEVLLAGNAVNFTASDIDITIVNPNPPFQLCIASGSVGLTAFGRTFEQDNANTGATAHPTRTAGKKYGAFSNPISGTTPGSPEELLFQKEIYGGAGGNNPSFSYDIPVSNGTYAVDLYFAEVFHPSSGGRIYDVILEGQVILDEYDLVDPVKDGLSSNQTAITRTYYVDVNDGVLSVGIGPASIDNGKLAGLCVTEVSNANLLPLSNIGNLSADATVATAISLNISDPENDNLTVTLFGLPASLSYNSGTGQIEGTPTALEAGNHTINAIISDGTSSAITEEFTLTVNPPIADTPPTIGAINDVEVNAGDDINVAIIVTDDNNPAATIEIFDISAGGTNNPFNPTAAISGYTFTDNGGGNYALAWTTSSADGRTYLARVTASDGVNVPATEEEFKIDIAQTIPGTILANTFTNPDPWYGGNPVSPFTVAIELAGNIGWIGAGEFVEYAVNIPTAGTYDVTFNASNGSGANGSSTNINILEEGNNIPIGTVTVPKTGWTPFIDYTISIPFANTGLQTLRLEFDGGVNVQQMVFAPPANSNTSPVVTITSPTNATTVIDGTSVNFVGTANDPEDGDISANLSWESDLDGAIGTGASFNIASLSVGTHTITASVTDNDVINPLSGDASISLEVVQAVALPLCLNVGNNLATALTAFGRSFVVDNPYLVNSGGTFNKLGTPIDGTVPGSGEAELFQTENFGSPLSYEIPTGDGSFTVELYFAELYIGLPGGGSALGTGDRIFDIDVEGTIESGIDMFDTYGPLTAFTKTYAVSVTDGVLDIDITASIDNGKLAGICITETANFTANAVPTISITPVADILDCENDGEDVTLVADANDLEQGNMDAIIVWKDDQGTVVGTGASLALTGLTGSTTYTAEVSDATPALASATITINVIANTVPVLTATSATPGSITVGSSVALTTTAADTEDDDNSLVVSWNSDLDGPLGTGLSLNVSSLTEGTHTITASVTDACSETTTATATVIVNAATNNPPVVSITSPADGATINRNVSTAFSATATDVEDGALTSSLTWSITPFESSFAGSGGSFNTSIFVPGTYVIQASVTDSDLNTVTEDITITVPGPDIDFTSPANASTVVGTDIQVTWTAANMFLDNTFQEHFHLYVNPADPNNLDPNDRISTASQIGQLFWDLSAADGVVIGNNTVVIVGAESGHTEFTNAEARSQVDFTVIAPGSPIASFTATPNPANCATQVAFDGSGSSHSGPFNIVSYEWDFDYDGTTFDIDASGSTSDNTYNAFGTFDVALRVTDDQVPALENIQIVSINLTSSAPTSVAGGPYSIVLGADLQLDGSGSSDPDGACSDVITTWEWDLDGNNDFLDAYGEQPLVLASALSTLGLGVGNHTVQLRVTDSQGLTNTSSGALSILSPGGPVATFTATPNPVECGVSVALDGSASSHSGPFNVVSYEWDFDYDGTTFMVDASGTTASTSYPTIGSYQVALRVTDDQAVPETNILAQAVNVTTSTAPISLVGGPYSINLGDDLILDGSGSSDPDAACGDNIVSYEWELNGDASFDDATGAQPTITALVLGTLGLGVGTHTVELRVTDSQGLQNTSSVSLDILALSTDVFFTINPALSNVNENDVFTVIVNVETNTQDIDLAEVHLSFDPTVLQVQNLTNLASAQLPLTIINPTPNNVAGTIDFAASKLPPGFPSGNFDLLQIEFVAIGGPTTNIDFTFGTPATIATFAFQNVLTGTTGATINVTENPELVITPNAFNEALISGNNTTNTFVVSTSDATPLPLDLNLTDDANAPDWLVINPTNDGYTIDATGLAAGNYTATITATGTGYDDAFATVNLVVTAAGIPTAFVEVIPGGGLGASTFGGTDKFIITNQSTGGLQITGVSIDLSTGLLPDMVFDPTGSGGDATAQCFTPGATAALVGVVVPADPCVDPFSVPRQGGFDVMSIDFTEFDPSESFGWVVDLDPNSIQGVPGAGGAGSVSGYELVGATVSVTFSDGSTLVGNLFEEGSLGGANALIAPNATVAPSIAVVGVTPTPATVIDANQTFTISGTPGDNVTLLQMDARTYIASGAAPFNVPDVTYYANDAMSGKFLYSAVIGAGGTVDIPVTLVRTPGTPVGSPDGGVNHFIAVTHTGAYSSVLQTSATSNPIILRYELGIPSAFLEVIPGGALDASTFGSPDKFILTNQSTGDVQITGISIDLSTGLLPDMVFDPTGTGGDATAQCFTAGPDATTVGLIAPADACIDPFSQPRQGGFDVMTIDFNEFDPTESFGWTVDLDPNSIQGVPGAGGAGAVSGYELIGATITISFSDGSTLVGNLFEEGSLGGSNALIAPTPTVAPSIAVVGTPTTPATVGDPNQTFTISGTPGDNVTLLQMDARTYIATGAAPFNVPDVTYYANEAMSGKTLYSAVIGAGGTVDIPVVLLKTVGTPAGSPDGGTNHFIAVTHTGAYGSAIQTSATSNPIILRFEQGATLDGNLSIPTLCTGETVIVQAYMPGTNTLVYTGTAPYVNGSGFVMTGFPAGTFDLYLKVDGYLQRLRANFVFTDGGITTVGFAVLLAGDVDGDNDVDINDFTLFSAAYLSADGDPNFNPSADFDCNGVINLQDFTLLSPQFNTTGEQP